MQRIKMRTENIRATILGNPEIETMWPRVETVGIVFEDEVAPLEFIGKLLRNQGFRSPEELRRKFTLPAGLLACQDAFHRGLPCTGEAKPEELLRQALILGLCGPSFYDPNKAVIWTNSRLLRRLDLFEPGRFYEDN